MSNCKISRNNAFDCEAINQGGILDYAYLVNFDDWTGAQTKTFDTGATEELTALVLAVGSQGYKIDAPKGSMHIVPSSPYRAVTALDGYDHTLDLRLFDVSQLARIEVEKMTRNKVIGIVPLANGKFEVYGSKVGLRCSDFQYNPGDSDTGGTMQIVLKTPDNDPPEISLPILIADSFDITSLDTPAE